MSEITYMKKEDVRLLVWSRRGQHVYRFEHVKPLGEAARPGIVFHRYVQRGGIYDGYDMVFYGRLDHSRFSGRFGAEWEVRVWIDQHGEDWDILARPDSSEPWRTLPLDHVPVAMPRERVPA